jgi:hypothetical protein
VTDKQEYLGRLKVAVEQNHNCSASYVKTVFVQDEFGGMTIWQGEVDVFSIANQATAAKRCYAWLARRIPSQSLNCPLWILL